MSLQRSRLLRPTIARSSLPNSLLSSPQSVLGSVGCSAGSVSGSAGLGRPQHSCAGTAHVWEEASSHQG